MNIYFGSTYNINKNFGLGLNRFCENVPNDSDWICIRDLDTMFLRPDTGKQIFDIVEKYKNKYQLIGCVTNRLAQPYQLYENKFSEEADIRKHIDIANNLHEKHYGEVELLNKIIAGCFMLFPKYVWKSIMFEENSYIFDKIFSKDIMNNGGETAIATGVYQFHLYRMWSDDPINDYKHLYI